MEDRIKFQKNWTDWSNELKLTRLNITRNKCKVDSHSEFVSQLRKNKREKTWFNSSCVKVVWVTWSTVWSSSQETSFGLRLQSKILHPKQKGNCFKVLYFHRSGFNVGWFISTRFLRKNMLSREMWPKW